MLPGLIPVKKQWRPGSLCYDAGIPMDNPIDRVIVTLNSLHVGDVDRILARLEEAEATLRQLAEEELVEKIGEARGAIQKGDVPLFRKRLQHVVSRLGHLR